MQPGSAHIFCNALPITQKSFEAEVFTPKKDFVSHYIRSRKIENLSYKWEDYAKELVTPYEIMKKSFSSYGFKFIDECTFYSYQAEVSNEANQVIILFSHCINNGTQNEEIEFFNALMKSENVISAIPIKASCIYDFAVCKSDYLFYKMQAERSQSVSGYSNQPIPLSIWLVIYSRVFYNMIVEKNDFLDAVDKVFREARKNRNKFLNQ